MFTGVVQTVGILKQIEQMAEDKKIAVEIDQLDTNSIVKGESIAVNGVCVTVVNIIKNLVYFDISAETLNRTTFNKLKEKDRVNIEQAMRLSDRLDGHLVSGHVDAVGSVISINEDGRSSRITFELPKQFSKYICEKGSVCIDGVSLTVNFTDQNRFGVNIIPHTLLHTIISSYEVGTSVNIEVDIVSRYLEKLHESYRDTKIQH